MMEHFEDLIWADARDPSRTIWVRHRPDRKLHKWEVMEDTQQGGFLSIHNTPSLFQAVRYAMRESHRAL